MKILKLTSSFPRYEGDHFGPWILEYGRELVRQGHDVTIIAPCPGNTPPDILSEDHLTVIRFNYWIPRKQQKLVFPPGIIPQLKKNKWRYFQIPFMLWNYYKTAQKILKKSSFDIIHSQWVIPSGFVGSLMARKFNIPHVITSQGAEFFLPTRHPFSYFSRYVLKNCDYLFPVSQQMANRALEYGIDENKIQVIPNAVNTTLFHPNIKTAFRRDHKYREDDLLILTIRRLVHEKRVKDVIQAFARIKDQRVKLLIGGDGPERNALESLVKTLSIEDQVQFLGFVNNDQLPPIYAACDIYVLSSQQEGLSLSLLESMSSEMIPVSTNTTGGDELIQDTENGYLYPTGDIDRLTQILTSLTTLPQPEREAIGRKARQSIIEKYSVKGMVRQWVEYYNQCL